MYSGLSKNVCKFELDMLRNMLLFYFYGEDLKSLHLSIYFPKLYIIPPPPPHQYTHILPESVYKHIYTQLLILHLRTCFSIYLYKYIDKVSIRSLIFQH